MDSTSSEIIQNLLPVGNHITTVTIIILVTTFEEASAWVNGIFLFHQWSAVVSFGFISDIE